MKSKKKRAEPTAEVIAAIAGVSVQLVYRKLRMGKTAKQIIAEACEREQAVVGREILGLPTVPVNGHGDSIPPFSF
jgi:hypothetical protein